MVTVLNLSVKLKKQTILEAINCFLPPCKITSFIGKSGVGKTTLLKSLAGLIAPADGQIIINNRSLESLTPRQRAETIGFVFQDFNLFPHFTVLENCTDPLRVYGLSASDAKERACNTLEEFGMGDFLDKYPVELSGGQQQRVALARALSLAPSVVLLDEPTASLDPFNIDILVDILSSLAAKGLTIAISSQDINFIRKISSIMYYLEAGTIRESCENSSTFTRSPLIERFLSSDRYETKIHIK